MMDRVRAVALGNSPADILLKNGRVVDVLTETIYEADVAIAEGMIAGVGSYDKAEKIIDLKGAYVAPGLINAHCHVESSMAVPEHYCAEELRWGVTTLITDPHEIANVAGAAGIHYMLDADDQVPEVENASVLQPDGHVQLEDVSFRYLPDRPLIEGLSLDVKPGQRIAIVGPTGCGKTTLINLLMRFYDVNGGSIKVSGTDIRDVTRASLRGSYGMVLQDTWLRAGTVRENIAYGKPDASLEEIVAAAKAAHADSFIRRLPEGYDTVIAEDGGNISQGQKQLLCIARVMLCLPPMLILDEATSSIDTRTEMQIQQAFETLMQGRTSFVVAHRLSTIQDANIILVMRDGKIVEQGDHAALLARGGFYATLYYSQFKQA